MVYLFIGVYAVLAVLVYLMFRILKKSVEKIDDQSKTYYIDKLQEYDELINDKEEKLNNLDEEIKNKRVEAESIKNDLHSDSIDFDINIIDVLSRTKYQDQSIFEIEKMINEKFNYDSEKIISEFLKRIDTFKNYEFCKKIRRKFSSKKLYELKILTANELEEKLKNMLTEKEYELLCAYKSTHKRFNLDEFINYLDELVELNSPKITVYVGSKSENYDYMSKYITTKIDPNIYKGIKIMYQSKIYDFSLNGKDL